MRSDERLFGDPRLLHALTPMRSVVRPYVKMCVFMAALAVCIVMIARPQFGQSTGTERRKGIEAVIMLDVSQSMLAQDVSPNRLERAKLLISNLVDRMKDDKIALGVFAGEAYPQLPITNDYVSARLFLDHISTDMIRVQGTDVAAAIRLASKSFTQQQGVGKAIIIITDGENHEGGAEEAAKEAAKDGRRVYMLGVGTSQGATIPTPEGLLTDGSGDVVVTALNAKMCQEIASAGKGTYIHVDGSHHAQDVLQNELAQLQHTDSTLVSDGAMNEQFQAAALLLFLLLIIELLISNRQLQFYSRFHIFSPKRRPLLVLALVFFAGAQTVCAQSEEYTWMHQGNRAFMRGEWARAEQFYRRTLEVNPRNARAMFNLGDAYLAQKNGKDALDCYVKAGKTETNRHVKAMAYHNIGFIHQNNKDYDRAIVAYKEALRNNPRDEDTRYNLALCQKIRKNQQDQQSQQKQDSNNGQQPQQQPEQQPQPKSPNQQQMSDDNAEQLLNLSRQSEQQTRQKLDKAQKARPKQLPKNW